MNNILGAQFKWATILAFISIIPLKQECWSWQHNCKFDYFAGICNLYISRKDDGMNFSISERFCCFTKEWQFCVFILNANVFIAATFHLQWLQSESLPGLMNTLFKNRFWSLPLSSAYTFSPTQRINLSQNTYFQTVRRKMIKAEFWSSWAQYTSRANLDKKQFHCTSSRFSVHYSSFQNCIASKSSPKKWALLGKGPFC